MTEPPPRLDWKPHCRDLAWPTLLLWVAVLSTGAATVVAAVHEVVPLAVGVAINTVCAYLVFTPMHEAAHGNIHGQQPRWRRLESLVGWTSGLALLAPFPAFAALHRRHHCHTNDPDQDPDMWVAATTATAVAARCMTIVPHYYWEFIVGPTARSRAGAHARRATLGTMAGLVGVMALSAALGVLSWVLWLWVVPAVVASAALAFAFDWLPHHPHAHQGRYGDTRVLPRWLTIPMVGQNDHWVHHLYPRVPFYAYARCARSQPAPRRQAAPQPSR